MKKLRLSRRPNDEMMLNDISSNTFHCSIIQYDEYHFIEHQFSDLNELNNYLDRTCCFSEDYSTWIIVEGIENQLLIEQISKRFQFHRLIEENLSQIHDRLKLDVLDDSSLIYLVMKMIYIHPENNQINQKQISFVLKEKNFLITFEEKSSDLKEFDLFQLLKSRLKNNRSRARGLKIDYVFYSLLDLIIENYSLVLNHIASEIDSIEKSILKKFQSKNKTKRGNNDANLNTEALRFLFQIKHRMLSFRILCQPFKEMIIKLQKTQDRISMFDHRSTHYRRQYRRKKRVKRINISGNYFYNPNVHLIDRPFHHEEPDGIFHEYIFIYFKDLHDQIIQLNDHIDHFCDTLASLTTFYIILLDAQMNEIMTCLSLVSIIFIPLNFILGSFSMNFETMPPLQWYYGYFLILALVLTSVLLMFSFFKWKKWL